MFSPQTLYDFFSLSQNDLPNDSLSPHSLLLWKKKMQLCEGDEGCKFQTFFLILPFHFVFHRGKKIIKNDTRVSKINEDNFHFWVNRPFKSDFQSKTPLNDFKILTYLYYLLAYVVLTHVIMLLSRDTNPMSCD